MDKKIKRLLIYAVFAICTSGVIVYLHTTTGAPESPLMYILFVNLVLGFIFYWLFPYYGAQLIMLVTAVSTGFYGFMTYAVGPFSILDGVYATIRLFFINLDVEVVENSGVFSKYPLAIELARWLAAGYTALALFAVASKLFGQSLKLFWYRLLGGHYVIFGYHGYTRVLIENLRRDRKRIVVIADESSETERDYLESLGAVVLFNQRSVKRFTKSRLNKAEYYLIFHKEDTRNLDELISIRDYLSKKRDKSFKPNVYLHLSTQKFYDLFEKIEKELKEGTNKEDYQNLRVRIINIHRLVAEKLWDDYPLYEGYEERVRDKKGESFNLAFIGFNETGKYVLFEALERAHFFNPDRLKAVILDNQGENLGKQWHLQNETIHNIVDTYFHNFDPETEKIDAFSSDLSDSSHIIVSLPDDFSNMTLGTKLSKKFPEKPIYIKMNDEALVSHWVHVNQDDFSNIRCFGNWNDVLNEQYFINEKMDDMAKKVHAGYKKDGGRGTLDEWNALNDFKKESNRKQVAHALTKVVLAGYQPVKEVRNGDIEVGIDEFQEKADSVLNELAAIEHRRWNAFHYLRGWDTYNRIKKGQSTDPVNKLHGCIVPYDDLPRVSKIVGVETPYEKHDENTIKRLNDTVVNHLEYKIVKDRSQ